MELADQSTHSFQFSKSWWLVQWIILNRKNRNCIHNLENWYYISVMFIFELIRLYFYQSHVMHELKLISGKL